MSGNRKKSVTEIGIPANSGIPVVPIFRYGDRKSEWAKIDFSENRKIIVM